MRLSGWLAAVGIVLLVAQHLWAPADEVPMPWHFGPLLLGLACLLGAVLVGLARGSATYRVAVVVGLVSGLVVTAAFVVPWDGGAAGPRPFPTRGQIVFAVGLGMAMLSALTAALAIAREARRARQAGRPVLPSDM